MDPSFRNLLMISPEHLIAYLETVSDITDVVGTVGGSHVPIVGELNKALGAYMPTKAIIVTSTGGPELQGILTTSLVGAWTLGVTVKQ